MNPRARRVLAIVTAGAVVSRLFVLGQQRGFALVAEATLTITFVALGCWLGHLVLHELAHLAAALSQDFAVRGLKLGPLAFDFAGPRRFSVRASLSGGVNSIPRGVEALRVRLRIVAGAGPLMTALATFTAWWFWRTRGETVASPLGVFMMMGALTLVTALLPGALLPNRPDSGTDLEQMLQPRAVLAHWVNAAAVQGLLVGRRLSDVLDRREWTALLPPDDGPVEAFELGWCIAALDAGGREAARVRLRAMVERFDNESPDWLKTDTFNQLGCLAALDGELVLAKTCLERVRETQSNEWYAELLIACIARAEGNDVGAPLGRWHAGVEKHPAKAVALAGNEWVLAAVSNV